MTQEVIMSGFGGQGIMLMGQLVTYAGMFDNKHVSWIPSYGPEMRGGTANCAVIVSEDPIGSPLISEPTTAIVMNLPSLDKFEPLVKAGGTLIINSSLIERESNRHDINVLKIPANDIASEIGNSKVANMIILGALIAATHIMTHESLLNAFAKIFANKLHLLEINQKAISRGIDYIKKV